MITLVVAASHTLLREGLVRLLAGHEDLTVLCEADSSRELLRVLERGHADVVLLEPGLASGGLEPLLRRIEVLPRPPRVLVLGPASRRVPPPRRTRGGIAEYLSRTADSDVLVQAIRTAGYGGSVEARPGKRRPASRPRTVAALSDREFAVLRLLGSGLTTRETADRLGLSHKTVATYRTRAKEKLGLRRNGALVRFAVENGLID